MGKAPDIFTATVHVQNNLGSGIHLTTHYQSRDNDLGERPCECRTHKPHRILVAWFFCFDSQTKRQPDLDPLTRNHRTVCADTTLGKKYEPSTRREILPVRGRRTTGKERRRFEEMDDMVKWSAARLKPNSYDFKVEVFNLEYDILNVDPDKYSYICFIKDVKRCVASKNEVVEMNPYEKFKVEVEVPLSRARYIVEGDDDMEFIFKQSKSCGKRVIRVYVEAIPVDFVEPRTLLEAQPEDSERFESGVVEGIEIGQGSGRVEGNQTGQGSGGVEDIEVQGEMSEYHEDNSYKGSTDDEDVVTRSKLYRANKLAKERSNKLHAESFTGLLKYDHIVKHTNPGVDGCHLKGLYGGVLLSAVSMDANNSIFPVAITICEIENNESWRYFMTLLKEFIGDIDHITIMSDRQKGLVDAIQTC
ncbi:hypothetical protein Pint_30269 [Pistacia integerrima]|uniref:Uncharacterized protein n=1 Tax=Pistacia integerrima TaxID=434235 RepID=A0ACC0X0Q3_9ROSI|nr:hypothetical protein Pint_30269 [Pistacia integerrima]